MSENQKFSRRRVKKKTKKKFRKRIIFFLLIPVLIVFLGLAGYGTYLYTKADEVLSQSYESDGREKSPLRDAKIDPTIDNVSVLIIGVDENKHRANNGENRYRSDALMVATFNKDEKSIKLLSIPRDSYVYIPERGYEDKITHAHYFGGHQSTIETVENLLDIPIDYYVKLNFHAFVDVVDALGGITAEVPYELKESNSMDKRDAIHLMPGVQELNGEEALALARTRKLDSDIERGKRQQEILKSVIKKAASLDSVLSYDKILEAVGDNMTTNMTFSDMKTFISYGTSGLNLDIETQSLEGYDYQPSGIYYYQLDPFALEETKTALKEHLELIPAAETESVNASANQESPY